MSQQGPGGYGPPPGGQGGWGAPPPGAPGGHGPPPGPGGYGPPPGAPPGGWGQPPAYGQPPGYGPPPQPGPPVPPAKKKSNTALLVGLGCGALLLLGGIASAAAYFLVVKPAQDLQASAAAAAAGLGVTVNVSDGGVSVQVPGSAVPGLTAGGLAAGGPVCDQAAACCKSMAEKAGADASAIAACENMKTLPLVGCTQALETYKRTAPIIGAKCP